MSLLRKTIAGAAIVGLGIWVAAAVQATGTSPAESRDRGTSGTTPSAHSPGTAAEGAAPTVESPSSPCAALPVDPEAHEIGPDAVARKLGADGEITPEDEALIACAAEAYWTPERMAGAQPAEIGIADIESEPPSVGPGRVSPEVVSGTESSPPAR